ncbi:MAG: PH domain-containing protein, partial [Nitrososphaeraceae archaeon]
MPFDFDDRKTDEDKEANHSNHSLQDGNDLEDVDKISDILNPDEKVLLVAKQSKIKPGGSTLTPNTIYATDRRIIIRDPYMLGIKANIVDIPYDIITSLKLEKGLLSSTIRFKAVGLMSSSKMGMMDSIVEGEDDQEGIIEAISKDKADDLMEIIRSGMKDNLKSAPEKNSTPEIVTQKDNLKSAPEKNSTPEIVTQKDYNSGENRGSVADEIDKLATLRDKGELTDQEFNKLKQNLINKHNN